MMAQAQRLILIAIDGSDNSEKAFQCTVLFQLFVWFKFQLKMISIIIVFVNVNEI